MISLRHVGLIVKDIEQSYKLYRDLLGFIPEIDHVEEGFFYEHLTGIKDGKARTSKCYAGDGSCIELIEYISHDPESRIKGLLSEGFNHIALNVENIDSLCLSIKILSKFLVLSPCSSIYLFTSLTYLSIFLRSEDQEIRLIKI